MGNRSSSIGGNTFTGRDLRLGTHRKSDDAFVFRNKKTISYTTELQGEHSRGLVERDMISGLGTELLGVGRFQQCYQCL